METIRIERVEERVAWLERHVAEQDKAMFELTETVERLKRELQSMRSRLATRDGSGDYEAPADEKPPHY
jgi:SlyX protein